MPTWPIPSISALLAPTLEHMGYELYAVEQSGQSGRTLRVSIDRAEPITIEDCERVSRVVGPLLDHAEIISGPYHLEVSSPGAERPLRGKGDYERFNGKRVNVRYRTGESETIVEGQLVAVDGAGIAVQSQPPRGRAPLSGVPTGSRRSRRSRGGEVIVHIAWDDVASGRLAVSF